MQIQTRRGSQISKSQRLKKSLQPQIGMENNQFKQYLGQVDEEWIY